MKLIRFHNKIKKVNMNFNNGTSFGKVNNKKHRLANRNSIKYKVSHLPKSTLNSSNYNYHRSRIKLMKKWMKDAIIFQQII